MTVRRRGRARRGSASPAQLPEVSRACRIAPPGWLQWQLADAGLVTWLPAGGLREEPVDIEL